MRKRPGPQSDPARERGAKPSRGAKRPSPRPDDATSRGRAKPPRRFDATAVWKATAPFWLLLLVYSPLYLLFSGSVKDEVLFGAALAVAWGAAWRLRWDPGASASILAGYLSVLSAPDTNLHLLAFVCFVPLFIALDGAGLWKSLWYGVLTGVTQVLIGFSWGAIAFSRYCDIGLLPAYLLFLPFTVLLSLKMPLFVLGDWANRRWIGAPSLAVRPCLFAVVEYWKWELYPWYFGLAAIGNTVAIQVADLGGAAALSALLIVANLGFYRVWTGWVQRERPVRWIEMAVAGGIVAAALVYGHARLHQIRAAEATAPRHLTVAAIQPNSPAILRSTDTEAIREVCETLETLTRQATTACSPDLVVYGEGATTVGYQSGFNPEFREVFDALAVKTGVPLLFDNIHFVDRDTYYRGALLLMPDLTIQGEYFKQLLAPFGEYVPFANVFPWMRTLFVYSKNYQRGSTLPPLEVAGVRLAPQICFEVLYPHVARRYVAQGGEILVNLTNDAWYGHEKETHQHFALARLRSVETRVPMARVANNGISGFVSATGEFLAEPSPYDEAWVGCHALPIASHFSLYRRVGDLFSWLCLAALVAMAARGLWRRRATST